MLPLSLLAFRSLASNRLRTAVVVVAVLLGITAFNAVLLTNDAIARGLELAGRTSIGNAHLQVRAVSSVGFAESTTARVRALPEVVAVAPVARKRVFYRTEHDHGFVELLAVDPVVEPQVRAYRLARGRFLSLERPEGVVVRAAWAEERGLEVGERIELITQDGLTSFEVVGLLAGDEAGIATYGSVVVVSLAAGRERFGLQDRISSLSLVLTSEDAVPGAREALGRQISEPHVMRSAPEVRADLARSVSELQTLLLLFGATALFVAIFLILNTLEMTVVEQAREIGQLRAAGATRPQIFSYFLQQALGPGVVGALLGAGAGYTLAELLAAAIARVQEVAVAPVNFSLAVAAFSITVGFVVVALSALSPALRASRTNPVDLLRESVQEAGRTDWRMVGAGTALVLVAAGGMLLPVEGVLGRLLRAALIFPFLGGLVFASRAAIVPLGGLFALLTRRVGGATARLAARNLLRHVGRTSLTVAGFMISLSLLVGITAVMVSSAQAGERWTRSLIPGDYVVVSPVEQPPIFIDQFAQLPGIRYASPVSFFAVRAGPFVVQIAALEPAAYGPGLEVVDGDRNAALTGIERGGGVLVPRRLAQARGLQRGDVLPLQTPDGVRDFPIAGVVAHSFPSADGGSTVLMNRRDAERAFGTQGFRLLIVAPVTNAAEVAGRVAELAERYGMSTTTAQNIAAEVATALARLLALLGALVAIGLLIGAFGTANTMVMNILERQRELSVLWASGMSRRQLQALALAEAGLMGLMGGILGVVAGGMLSWLLVRFSRTPGFEPEYVFPWLAALLGITLAVVSAGVAAIGPAQRIARLTGR